MIKTGNPVISIYTEMTPNPETMKFVANKLLYPGKSIDFQEVDNALNQARKEVGQRYDFKGATAEITLVCRNCSRACGCCNSRCRAG